MRMDELDVLVNLSNPDFSKSGLADVYVMADKKGFIVSLEIDNIGFEANIEIDGYYHHGFVNENAVLRFHYKYANENKWYDSFSVDLVRAVQDYAISEIGFDYETVIRMFTHNDNVLEKLAKEETPSDVASFIENIFLQKGFIQKNMIVPEEFFMEINKKEFVADYCVYGKKHSHYDKYIEVELVIENDARSELNNFIQDAMLDSREGS